MNFIEFESGQKLRGGFYTEPSIASFLVKWIKQCYIGVNMNDEQIAIRQRRIRGLLPSRLTQALAPLQNSPPSAT